MKIHHFNNLASGLVDWLGIFFITQSSCNGLRYKGNKRKQELWYAIVIAIVYGWCFYVMFMKGNWQNKCGWKINMTLIDKCCILKDCNYGNLSGKITGIANGNSSKSGEAFICTCPGNRDILVGENSNSFPKLQSLGIQHKLQLFHQYVMNFYSSLTTFYFRSYIMGGLGAEMLKLYLVSCMLIWMLMLNVLDLKSEVK